MILIYTWLMVMELLGRIFTIVTNHLYHGSKGWKFALVLQRDLITFTRTGAKYTINIHRDVKTTNILLDENWEAKASHFPVLDYRKMVLN